MSTGSLFLKAPLRAIERWYDSAHAVPILLVTFVILWSACHVIAYLPINLHPDVVEVFGWGRHPSPGYYKHPPLGGLMSGAWFALFPATDWSAHTMAIANAALSLAVVDLIARRYLSGDKRLMVLLLLMLTPFYQFQSLRFASNQTLLLTWPLAVYCFLRAFESRAIAWSIAAGVAAALAMLGKYFSIYLLGALIVAALVHPARWRYLRSPSPWISIAAGLAVMAPHLIWLHQIGYLPFTYARTVLETASRLDAAATVPAYLAGAIAYVALPVAVFALATRTPPAEILRSLWPRDPDRRQLAALQWAMILLPTVGAPLLSAKITSLWTMQAWFLLPILLLLPDNVQLRRESAVAVAGGLAAFSLAALLASPALAWFKHGTPSRDGRAYYDLAANELTRQWRQVSTRPLTIVVGDQDFANAMTFYVAGHPDSVPGFDLSASPWVTSQRMQREGFVAICLDEGCVSRAVRLAAGHTGVRRTNIELVRTFWGRSTPPQRLILVLAPPRS